MSSPDFSINELRSKFLKFFEARGHKVIPPSSLVPENDPTVLFTTAGMQQFKKFYSNPDEAPSANAATIQPCVRTNDIEEVGDATHLTFFEMLGNFSFGYPSKEGSYFKKEAIEMAWEFLTKELGVAKERVHATYFDHNLAKKGVMITKETDEVSKKVLERLKDNGLGKIEACGEDNFWSLGTEGSPGGPTVEFYIDGVEIWNLVFNELFFMGDHWEDSAKKGVDTGMGFERLLAVLNKAENLYHTELYDLPHKKLHELLKNESAVDERIVLDHIKSSVFILAEGVTPSNKLQGYVLRRLIRRAVVKARNLGIDSNFTSELARAVIEIYKDIYPNLAKLQTTIEEEISKEETKFRKTLKAGLSEFEKNIEILISWSDQKPESKGKFFPGVIAFNLFATYGFPIELTREIAKDKGLELDEKGFEREFKKHQEISRAGVSQFKGGLADAKEETTKLHTAAHLLHAALRRVLGEHVLQKGSNITAERLRFDFSHPDKLTEEQIKQVEDLVNEQIQKNIPVEMEEMIVEEAKKSGALGVFDDRYGNKVKVYTIGDFSKEICGGPHAQSTGDLGHFKITNEQSSSAGIRRIKAILE